MTKKEQRQIIKKRLGNFYEKGQASQKIAAKLFELEEYKKAKSIFIYLSLDYEVDTKMIIKDAFQKGKKVFVPIVKKNNQMSLARIFPMSVYKKDKYGIRTPIIRVLAKKDPDIAIIPLAGFDKEKNRLGKGGGYYDRFLANHKGKTIALAFGCQELEKVQTLSHDIKPHKIITEDKIF